MTFTDKQVHLKLLFEQCISPDSRYQKIIELGKSLPNFQSHFKIPENLVKGCQSQTYLHSYLEEGVVIFEATSDALISKGLAALLIQVYSGEPPLVILQNPPTYLEELGITNSLTPNRANGLFSMHLHMKQTALSYFRLIT